MSTSLMALFKGINKGDILKANSLRDAEAIAIDSLPIPHMKIFKVIKIGIMWWIFIIIVVLTIVGYYKIKNNNGGIPEVVVGGVMFLLLILYIWRYGFWSIGYEAADLNYYSPGRVYIRKLWNKKKYGKKSNNRRRKGRGEEQSNDEDSDDDSDDDDEFLSLVMP